MDVINKDNSKQIYRLKGTEQVIKDGGGELSTGYG